MFKLFDKSFFQEVHSILLTFFPSLAFSEILLPMRHIHKPQTRRDILVTPNFAVF